MKNTSSLVIKETVLAIALVFLFASLGLSFGTKMVQQSSNQQLKPIDSELKGTVKETMNAGGYSYVLLEQKEGQVWVAMPAQPVKVGDQMNLQPGQQMGPFTSKTLDRTFETIIFSGGPLQQNPAALPASHPAIPNAAAAMPEGHPDISKATAPAQVAPGADKAAPKLVGLEGKLVETFDSGGYTYLCVEKDGQKSWAAVPAVKVAVGDELVVRPGMEMGEYTSKTLERTFDNILFSPGIQVN